MKRILATAAALAVGFGATAAMAGDVTISVSGPFTGSLASFGAQLKTGAEAAMKDINAAGGVNGSMLKVVYGDDACDPKQAVAVANKNAADKVSAVIGHFCSGSSIPASKVYDEAGIVQISAASTNPDFTDKGGWNVHRVCGRDDAQGRVAGAFLAKKYAGKAIAILHDKSAYGKGLADQTKMAANKAGLTEAMYEAINPGEKDYTAIVSKLKEAKVEAVYLGGYHPEGGLIQRQMREQGLNAQLIMGDSVNTKEFWTITGDSGEGMLFTFAPDPQKFPEAKAVVDGIKAGGGNPEGYTLYSYAAIQTWAAAAKATGGFDSHKIAEWLRAGNEMSTVIGKIKMDKKGDIIDPIYVFYKWSKGEYNETMTP